MFTKGPPDVSRSHIERVYQAVPCRLSRRSAKRLASSVFKRLILPAELAGGSVVLIHRRSAPLTPTLQGGADAKVIGVYTQGALAVTAQSPGTPALVALAVIQQQAQAIMPYEGSGAAVTLVALGR